MKSIFNWFGSNSETKSNINVMGDSLKAASTPTPITPKQTGPLSPEVFRHMSVDLAYKANRPNYEDEKAKTAAKLEGSGWKIIANTGTNSANSDYSYKAVAFYNEITKEVHFASAGTDKDYKDVWDDILLGFRQVPTKINAIKNFVDEVLEILGPDAVGLTYSSAGHSLGGPLSALVAAYLQSMGYDVIALITYDSAGAKPIIEKAIADGYIDPIDIKKFEEYSHNEIVKPNWVNTLNAHTGSTTLVLANEYTHDEPSSYMGQVTNTVFKYLGSATHTILNKVGYTSVWDLPARIEDMPMNVGNLGLHGLANFNPENNLVKVPLAEGQGAKHGQKIIDPSAFEVLKNVPEQTNAKHPLALITTNDADDDIFYDAETGDKSEDTGYVMVNLKTLTFNDVVAAYNKFNSNNPIKELDDNDYDLIEEINCHNEYNEDGLIMIGYNDIIGGSAPTQHYIEVM